MRVNGIGLWVLIIGMLGSGMVVQAATTAESSSGALDGKTFVGEMGSKDKAKGDPDQFRFRDGQFRSTACDPYGFDDAPYMTSIQGDALTFEAQTESPTEGRIVWEGIVRGDHLEGTAMWYKKQADAAQEEMWFKGTTQP